MAFKDHLALGICCILLLIGHLDANAPAAAKEFGLDAAQRTKIVDDHNTLRSTLPAADMARIAWWTDGAKEASKLVETCSEKVETKFGKVVIFSVATDFKPEGLVDEIKKQQDAYSDVTNQCIYKAGKCEDYRQIIVGSNQFVGCALKSCAAGTFTKADGKKEAKAVQLIVCLYPDQADTRQQKHQYTKGTHCTKCDTISPGLWCKDKLCTSQEQCTDDIAACSSVDDAKCASDAEAKKKCPMKCKTCTCKLECENCGKRYPQGCGCDCIPGYHGGICKEPCKDHSTTNCTKDTVHSCQLYTKKRAMCPLLCGLCKYEANPVCKAPPGPISLNQVSNAIMDAGRSIDCRKEIWCLKGRPYLHGSTCKCRCQEGWQGKLCNKNTIEAENGVMLTIQGKKDKYGSILAKLRELIAKEMNKFCKENINRCCPFERDQKNISKDAKYTEVNRVRVGSGYPDFAKDGTFTLLIFAMYQPDNSLCTDIGTKLKRKKREVTTGCPVGFRKVNDKCIYDVKVPRQIILDALKNRRSEMNKDMCCGAVIDTVDLAAAYVKPYVNERADIKTVFHDWERILIILGIIMGGFIIFIVLAIFYTNKKTQTKRMLATERESKRGDNFLMRMEQARQQKLQQEKDARIAYEREMRRINPQWTPDDIPAQAEVGYEPYNQGPSAHNNGGCEHEHDCPQHRCDSPCPHRDHRASAQVVHASPYLGRGDPHVRGSTRSDYRMAPLQGPHRSSTRSDYRVDQGGPSEAAGGEPYQPYRHAQL